MNSKQTAYSILELALISKGQSVQQTYANSVKLAQKAEELGYTRIWFAEHHNMMAVGSNAPTVLIGHIAEMTSVIRVGSGGVMLPNHSPLVVAEQFGTLGNLYPNRIDLGLGRAPGTDRDTALAIKSDFLQASHSFPNDVEQIQMLFSKQNESAKVRAVVAEGVEVPIYILGSSTDSAHLASKKGLPYAFASHFATAYLDEALAIYRSQFKPSVDLDSPYVIAGVNVIIADTDAEAKRLFTSSLRMIIGMFTGKRDYLNPPTEMTSDLEEIIQHPQIQNMIKYSFIGSKETVKEKVKAFLEQTQADELIVSTNVYDVNDRLYSVERFSEVMREMNNI
ncbi:LLM class flavin-dependent oxidoreductase [Aestuariibaculum suncheonense]|uniref:Luciferase-like monooxygenase n=1 Tax=Aestuariibaculum suncheonense TaxID=1028745 RepID=A0A8J6UK03_9FLAO|nr:LLM class flavin-dependent oxidoreductase [Aestuariibaculum suncheonense]MBD0835261.1 LLM class flavin-dependent oxidoreductase [Aestuariibaculum suncheonense]